MKGGVFGCDPCDWTPESIPGATHCPFCGDELTEGGKKKVPSLRDKLLDLMPPAARFRGLIAFFGRSESDLVE